MIMMPDRNVENGDIVVVGFSLNTKTRRKTKDLVLGEGCMLMFSWCHDMPEFVVEACVLCVFISEASFS